MKVWCVSGGNRGTDVQLEAVGRALSDDVTFFHADLPFPWHLLAPYRLAEIGVAGDERLRRPCPDILIAGGRRAVPFARAMRRRAGGGCFTVCLQNPHVHPKSFDFIWAPMHDRVKGGNVLTTLTGPHGLTAANLSEASDKWRDRLVSPRIGGKHVGVLIGGPNRYFSFKDAEMEKLSQHLLALAKEGHKPLISLSSRSRTSYMDILRNTLQGRDHYLWDGRGDNPYRGILGLADHFIVTADSVNMAGEACFRGVPVQLFFLKGRANRFGRFYDALIENGFVRPFDGRLEFWQTKPQNPTGEIVDGIREAYKAHLEARKPDRLN